MKKIEKALVTMLAVVTVLIVFNYSVGKEQSVQAVEANEAVVSSSAQLQSALANGSIDTIYMSNNITISSSMPINNSSSRRTNSLTIYGYNPYMGDDPATTRYTLTETSTYKTTSGNRIFVSATSGSLRKISLRNMNVYGTDSYGTVYVAPTVSRYTGMRLEYIDFDYTGPQLTYNIYGTAYYENANIILAQTSGDATGEVAETTYVYFAGDVNITKSAGCDARDDANELFWGSNCVAMRITALEGSNVNVQNDRKVSGTCADYDASGFIATKKKGYDTITIEKNASFIYRGYGLFADQEMLLESFTVGQNAYVDIVVDGNIRCSTFYYKKFSGLVAAKNITVNEGATLYVAWKNVSLERQALQAKSRMTFNNPKHVVLYSSGADAVKTILKGALVSINNVKNINMWTYSPTYSTTPANPTYTYYNNQNGSIYANFIKLKGAAYSVSSSGISNPATLHLIGRRVIEINGYGYDKYTVTYDANGGTGSVVDSNQYSAGDMVTVLSGSGLTRANYTFTGWNTSANGNGISYVPGSTFTLTGNVVLYAQWAQNKSAPPTINSVAENHDTVTGGGIPGSAIAVTFPSGTTVNTTVPVSGTWGVDVPARVTLTEGDVISANQTEVGKTVSDNVYTTVTGDTTVWGNIDVYMENLSRDEDYAMEGDTVLYDAWISNDGTPASIWEEAYVTFNLNGSVTLRENSIRINNRLVNSSQYTFDRTTNTLTVYLGNIRGGGGVGVSFRVVVNNNIPDLKQIVINTEIGSLVTRSIIYKG